MNIEDLEKLAAAKQENKKNVSADIVFWIFGAFFLLLGFCSICEGCIIDMGDCIAGLFFLLAAAMAIPPVSTKLEEKLNISITETTKLVVAFALFSAALIALPPPDIHLEGDHNVTLVTATISFDNNNTAIPSDQVSVSAPENAIAENHENLTT